MRVVALAVVCLLLAGCGGKASGVNKVRLGDGNLVSLDVREDQKPAADDLYGTISGLVVNDAIYPVDRATVTIRGLERSNGTDENGRFVFEHVPPGLWTLEVNKVDHDEGLGTVNVKSGDVVKSVLLLKRSPYVAPYHQTTVIDVFSSAQDRLVTGPREHVVGLDGGLRTLIIEAKWDALTPVLSDPLDYTFATEGGNETDGNGHGPNPLRVQVDGESVPEGTYAVRVDVHPSDPSAPPDSSGRIFVTAFYLDPAPEGWSFVKGDQ